MKIDCHTELALDISIVPIFEGIGWKIVIYFASGRRYDNEVEHYTIGGNSLFLSLTEGHIEITSEQDDFSLKSVYMSRDKETEILVLPHDFPQIKEKSICVRHNW